MTISSMYSESFSDFLFSGTSTIVLTHDLKSPPRLTLINVNLVFSASQRLSLVKGSV